MPLSHCGLSHLGRRFFTSARIAPQRWFKSASLSFKKLPSVGESFWTIMSPVLFSAAKLGWWLLVPSSSSYKRAPPKMKSTAKWNCSDAVDYPKYHAINVSVVRQQSPGRIYYVHEKGILKQFHFISMNTPNKIYFEI